MSKHHTLIGGVLIAAALFGAQPGFAQTTTAATMPAPYGLFLTTPHPEVKVPPGKPVSFPLQTDQRHRTSGAARSGAHRAS